MKFKILFLITALALSTAVAFAEKGRVGNGGFGRVCLDAEKQIVSATVLDVYEAQVESASSEDIVDADADRIYDRAYSRLKNVNKASAEEFQTKFAQLKTLASAYPVDKSPDSKDIFTLVEAGQGCHFEQIFNFVNEKTMFVNGNVYRKMTEADHAILFIHETIYWMARVHGGEENSNDVRPFVANLVMKKRQMKRIKAQAKNLGLN